MIDNLFAYISLEQALSFGFLIPLSNSSITLDGSRPGYGVLPPLNTSQHSTPYDH